MFEQALKNIDNILRKDAGCSTAIDYIEQTTWVLFLKYLETLENDKKTAAELSGLTYKYIIADEFKWSVWAAPKLADGKLDHHKAVGGDDLIQFLNQKLIPYLKKFKQSSIKSDSIEYKIGEVFSELNNKIQSGYNLREVINLVDTLEFKTAEERHEMSHLYESKIKDMGNAGKNGGEYYTPRALIKSIIKVVNPEIGDTIYDGAVGSAGFMVEAFDYLRASKELTTKDIETLQKSTFYGKEKKSLAYIIGIMNMIFHGIEAPNILHTNTLAENIRDIQDKDRHDIVLANPPFGGSEMESVQQNFTIKTSATEYLFLQHFMKILKVQGKAGIIIKNTFLSNTDNASVAIRKELLDTCNLHTILDMPGGTFIGAGVKTVVLFFTKGEPTKNIWYYQPDIERNMGKTNPLNEKDLADFVESSKTKPDTENSWTVSIDDVDNKTWDLTISNPNRVEEVDNRTPEEILAEIEGLDKEASVSLKAIKELL